MTDEDKQVIAKLRDYGDAMYGSTIFNYAADRLEELLGKTKPPPDGSIPVRIACVFSRRYWGARWIAGLSDSEALDNARGDINSEPITHEAIIAVNIPARVVPVVSGVAESSS